MRRILLLAAVAFGIVGCDRTLATEPGPAPTPAPPVMPPQVPGFNLIEVGKEYSFDVLTSDPPCDPVHWDASAPCVRLRFLAPRSGTGKVQFTWESSGDVDLLLMSDAEDYLQYAAGGRSLELTYQLAGGTHYILWVHSYYGPATFKVRVDMVP